MTRIDGRAPAELRSIRITPNYLTFAEGSALIEMGETRVLCAATVEDKVPPFLQDTGQGWITAEYAMLPRSTPTRTPRESVQGRLQGRTMEIQRLVGRSLRSVVDLRALGPRTITVDCDVIQADGGTRCAAVSGGYVALVLALRHLVRLGEIPAVPIYTPVAAVSVGIVEGEDLLDLCYHEDSQAAVDFNVVMTGTGHFVEVQGTAEREPFDKAAMDRLLALAARGIKEIFAIQERVLAAQEA